MIVSEEETNLIKQDRHPKLLWRPKPKIWNLKPLS